MKVLISGGGIAGLTTALCLQKSGHDVQVFEQSAQLSILGAGLQLGANALHVLEYLGLLTELNDLVVSPESVDFRNYLNGKILYSALLGRTYHEKYQQPYWHVYRADLQKVLVNALGGSVELICNARVESVEDDGHVVTVKLKNGETYQGDCLIGADGIKSSVRQVVAPNTHPRFTNNVAWRGVLPVEKLPTNFMDKVVTNFVGPKKHMVVYYLREQKLINFVGVVESKKSEPESHSCYRWGLYDHAPIRSWTTGNVTLLGDSAHACLPFLASGASMAIEDARILQRALDQYENLPEALQLYQRNRLYRTAKIQKLSRQAAKLYHISHPLVLKAAFKAVKLKAKQTEVFLANYNPNTVTLI